MADTQSGTTSPQIPSQPHWQSATPDYSPADPQHPAHQVYRQRQPVAPQAPTNEPAPQEHQQRATAEYDDYTPNPTAAAAENTSSPNHQESPANQADSIKQEQSSSSKQPKTADSDRLFPGVPKPLPEETVLKWTAASRPFKKRNRQFYTTVFIIVVLVCLILFFAGQFLPIAVVISVAFLAYVLASVPPQPSEYKLTTYGIRIEENLYYWEEMTRFWFDQKYGQKLVQIEILRFPGRITMLLGDLPEKEFEEILSEVLVKEKPADTFFDKSAKWLQEKIPLDTD